MSILEFSQLLGSLGEFVGAIAVVATLFYLAVQVRHSREAVDANTKLVKAQTRDSIAGKTMSVTELFVSTPELWDVNRRVLNGEEASREELAAVRYQMGHMLRAWENEWYQYQQGLYEEDEFRPHQALWRQLFQYRWLRDYWAEGKFQYSLTFQKEMDRLLADPVVDHQLA